MDFRGFDSSIILNLRGGIPRTIGNFPESLSHAILVGTMLVGRSGVQSTNSRGGEQSATRPKGRGSHRIRVLYSADTGITRFRSASHLIVICMCPLFRGPLIPSLNALIQPYSNNMFIQIRPHMFAAMRTQGRRKSQ